MKVVELIPYIAALVVGALHYISAVRTNSKISETVSNEFKIVINLVKGSFLVLLAILCWFGITLLGEVRTLESKLETVYNQQESLSVSDEVLRLIETEINTEGKTTYVNPVYKTDYEVIVGGEKYLVNFNSDLSEIVEVKEVIIK